MTRVAALVPMRHESERVPGKNYRALGGRPLFHHIVEALLATPAISDVVIDTDSDLIRKDAVEVFPGVRVLERPEELRGGLVPMNEILMHDVQLIDADYYLQTHSTNPFLRSETIARGIEAFLAGREEHDSLFGVTRLQARLWSADSSPINHDPGLLARTQDLPPVFLENSCLYLFSRDSLERHQSRIGERPLMFEIPRDEALDIDDEADFALAEALARSRVEA
jgi:CMP-N-acetylneuraminic acid synthetase